MDVNEQFARDRSAGYDQAEYVGKDGLDTSLGRAALFTRVPAWHGLGYVAEPGRTYSVAEILDKAGVGFKVEKRLVRYSFGLDDPSKPHFHQFDGRYVLVRNDTAAPLGIASDIYEVFQTVDVAAFMDEMAYGDGLELVDESERLVIESAGALRGGQKVFITGRLPWHVVIDPSGVADEIVPFLGSVNDFTGKGSYWTGLTPWRMVCANTVRFAIKGAPYKWTIRHTKGGLDRVAEAQESLRLSSVYLDKFQTEETQLAQTELLLDEFVDLLRELWPTDEDASDRVKANALDRELQLVGAWESEDKTIDNCRGTAYGAENVISRYLDWFTDVGISNKVEGDSNVVRATRLMEGYGDDMKTKAHRLLMSR